MIIGIGTDIIEIDRVALACENQNFRIKYFTKAELDYFDKLKNKGAESMAGSFAAKEAVAKALGTGFSGFMPGDIEILRRESGKPIVKLYGNALTISQNMNISQIHISISHCKKMAIAYAVAENSSR